MKTIVKVMVILCIVAGIGCKHKKGKPKVLVFTKTAGYHHSAIPVGVETIEKLGIGNNFDVDTTSDAGFFTEDTLKKYAAVVFLNTTGNLLNNYQEADFERFIQAGGGYVGVHAAADAEYDWGWYGRLVGAYFDSHPEQQEAVIKVVDTTNEATKHLPHLWKRKDEWYNFKKINKDIHVLLEIDEKSYTGGKNGEHHPMAWYHDYDGGRAWYTELGHTEASYADSNYIKHLLAGIQYAIGNNSLNYSKAISMRTPDADRFTKTSLVTGTFFEPTEMTILPNLDILVVQRRGEFMLYSNETKTVKQVGFLNVYYRALTQGGSTEMGLLGVQADPDFAKNHYIYAMYSPSDTSVDRLSRFTLEGDTIDIKSEKVILDVHTTREICCHTGGSIAFGADHMLFVSTGDNSTPFNEANEIYNLYSFAPLDDRPGHERYDARRGAGNTNDLRGKILRIKINPDGTYSIPEGNLFPKGTPKTRPEIYVMGDRNPYRIAVDKKTGFLYWGEVGPDANADSLDTRGPRGYDEVNQARKAGNFGWPYFVGNNYPYHEYDFNTGVSGAAFDPAKPLNNSRNNTGLRELPPAQPAFVWYPYGESPDFPQVGSGGRTAMAGPVYYSNMYRPSTKLPDYYNKKFFMYDWVRGWIKAVTMRDNGDFDKMEPFAANLHFNAPVDMEMGPDGRLYILEYGSGWFAKNADAGLARIDYNMGNRSPAITDMTVNKLTGKLPFSITASVKAKDPENDEIAYVWHIGNDSIETMKPYIDYTFNVAGDNDIYVTVKDDKGASATSKTVSVYAGNETPRVDIEIKGNKTFYFPNKAVGYVVKINDSDDTAKGKDMSDLFVSANYFEGKDNTIALGHQLISETVQGKNLMLSLDCKSCHKIAEPSVGPSFTDVAKHYDKDNGATELLANKIIKGGAGVWGETAMAAHPSLKMEDAKTIVGWIRSLAKEEQKSLPANGSLVPGLGQPIKDNGMLTITATYSNKGSEGIKPLSGSDGVVLRNSKMSFEGSKKMQGFSLIRDKGNAYAQAPKNTGWIAIERIDMTLINKAALVLGWSKQPVSAYSFEMHLDAPDGKLIGKFVFNGIATENTDPANSATAVTSAAIDEVTDGNLHTIYIVSKGADANVANQIVLSSIQFFAR